MIRLAPSIQEEEFKKKWNDILNQASCELIKLLVRQHSSKLEELLKERNQLSREMDTIWESEDKQQFIMEIEESLVPREMELREMKDGKLERDRRQKRQSDRTQRIQQPSKVKYSDIVKNHIREQLKKPTSDAYNEGRKQNQKYQKPSYNERFKNSDPSSGEYNQRRHQHRKKDFGTSERNTLQGMTAKSQQLKGRKQDSSEDEDHTSERFNYKPQQHQKDDFGLRAKHTLRSTTANSNHYKGRKQDSGEDDDLPSERFNRRRHQHQKEDFLRKERSTLRNMTSKLKKLKVTDQDSGEEDANQSAINDNTYQRRNREKRDTSDYLYSNFWMEPFHKGRTKYQARY